MNSLKSLTVMCIAIRCDFHSQTTVEKVTQQIVVYWLKMIAVFIVCNFKKFRFLWMYLHIFWTVSTGVNAAFRFNFRSFARCVRDWHAWAQLEFLHFLHSCPLPLHCCRLHSDAFKWISIWWKDRNFSYFMHQNEELTEIESKCSIDSSR